MWSNNKGFTLLENLIAASILAITVTALLQVFSINLRSLTYSEDYIKAYMRADEVIKDIHLLKDLQESTQAIKDPDGTTILWEARRVDIDRTKDIPVELYEISVKVSWTKGTKERQITLTTFKSTVKKV
ncbi:MAG: prepilin-type N-terminal cleavage/methylation domain-containing protein [Thermodesulfovibrionales bacterium]|nr:prepilin-type N-terminal cleavage/methylation domain-containing protein [Thermodesulfovibrionales bacterium]